MSTASFPPTRWIASRLARRGLERRQGDADKIGLAAQPAGSAFVARAFAWHRYVGFFKTLRTTRWARYDTRLYCPLFFLLGVSLLYLAVAN